MEGWERIGKDRRVEGLGDRGIGYERDMMVGT